MSVYNGSDTQWTGTRTAAEIFPRAGFISSVDTFITAVWGESANFAVQAASTDTSDNITVEAENRIQQLSRISFPGGGEGLTLRHSILRLRNIPIQLGNI